MDCYKSNPRNINKTSADGNIDIVLIRNSNSRVSDKAGWAPLHVAAEREIWKVRVLVEKGADINIRNKRGQTPIMVAAMEKNTEIVNYLLKEGADIGIKDDRGENLLHYCESFSPKKTGEGFKKIIIDLKHKHLMEMAAWELDRPDQIVIEKDKMPPLVVDDMELN